MAVDDGMRMREAGTHVLTEAEMAGTRGANGDGVLLPTVGYANPGPTSDRGVEANTNPDSSANCYPLPKQDGSLSAMGEVIRGTDPHGDV